MVRMEVADTAVGHLGTRSWPPRSVSRSSGCSSWVTGTRCRDQLDEISYRIRALDPDLMSDERFDEQVRRLRAGRDRLKALPAEPGRRDSLPAGDLYAGIYQTLPELPRVSRTGNSRLIYAAVPIPSSSSMTSRGVLYPSVE